MRQEIRTLTRCFFCTLAEKLQHSDLVTYLCNFIVMHFFSFVNAIFIRVCILILV